MTRSLPALVGALLVASAAAQTPEPAALQLGYNNLDTQAAVQEMWNAFRTLIEIRNVTDDPSLKRFTVSATPAQLALAQWMIDQLDKPSEWKTTGSSMSSYTYTAGADTAVRVFFLANAATMTDIQEIQNILRTGADIQRVIPFTGQKALAVRGTPERVAAAEWLVRELDQPIRAHRPTASYEFLQQMDGPGARSKSFRIFYLQNLTNVASMQELQNVLRTGADIQRVFPLLSRMALVVRGEPERVAAGEWLVSQLDLKADVERKTADYTYESLDPPDRDQVNSAVRVVYLHNLNQPAAIQDLIRRVRTEAQAQRIFYCSSARAIALRTSPNSAALAEKMIADADQPTR